MAERIVADREIDITGEICPMTFVRTRLALDGMQSGQRLAVLLRGEEPTRNVPETARQQGHLVLAEEAMADGATRVVIERQGKPSFFEKKDQKTFPDGAPGAGVALTKPL
jgi:TusA-related sulfurtransferase